VRREKEREKEKEKEKEKDSALSAISAVKKAFELRLQR
jgi:hypothetical protein